MNRVRLYCLRYSALAIGLTAGAAAMFGSAEGYPYLDRVLARVVWSAVGTLCLKVARKTISNCSDPIEIQSALSFLLTAWLFRQWQSTATFAGLLIRPR